MRRILNTCVQGLLVASSLLVLACGSGKATDPAANADNGSSEAGGSLAASSGTGGAGVAGSATANGGASSVGSGGTAKGGSGVGTGGAATGGSVGTGGTDDSYGAGGDAGGAAGSGNAGGGADCGSDDSEVVGTEEKFSFFVTSLTAMRSLSGSQDGFGGDLRFGETGPGAGLRGADKICRTIAERSMPGAGAKGWRAFLSASTDGCGSGPVHAIERISDGPWYDRLGRLVAEDRQALLGDRPTGAEAVIAEDLPNEDGVPNHKDVDAQCGMYTCTDNHDTLTGSDLAGKLFTPGSKDTCDDWTSAANTGGRPTVGHSWSSTSSGTNWIKAHWALGCLPGVIDPIQTQIEQSVGFSGGYGGFYCFASAP